MNILVTGGAGYIGTELVYKLSLLNHVTKIVVYDNLSRNNFNLFYGPETIDKAKIQFVKGDVLDSRKLSSTIKDIDVVYHLAAKVTTPFADHNPHIFDQINNWGTAELSYILEDSNVKEIYHLSSASVYGSSSDKSTINTIPDPKTFYGISKLRGEEHIKRLLESDIKTYIFRSGNVYGYSKSMRLDSVINRFTFEANFQKRIKVFGDGLQQRSFINVHRLCDFLTNISNESISPGIYNLVESSFSVMDIVESIKSIYPNLEMIFANQNMKMRNLLVETDNRIKSINHIDNLIPDLLEFKNNFTF